MWVEDLLSLEHEVDGTTELLGDDGKSLGLAVAADELLVIELSGLVVAQEKDCCLAEGPLQVSVTDLGVGRAALLARRLVGTLDKASVGDEVGDLGEAADVLDLVEDQK